MDVERRSRSTCLSKMSTVSLDSGHVVVEVGDSLGYEARLVEAIFFMKCVYLERFCDLIHSVRNKSNGSDEP